MSSAESLPDLGALPDAGLLSHRRGLILRALINTDVQTLPKALGLSGNVTQDFYSHRDVPSYKN